MMSPLNAELIVKQWLEADDALAGYPVSFDVPATRPERFVTVERVGGGSDGVLDSPTIAVQVWETSRWNASDAATRLVKPSLLNLVEHDEIGAIDILSIINNPDPESGQARYQITLQATSVA